MGRGSETQHQVGDKSYSIVYRFEGEAGSKVHNVIKWRQQQCVSYKKLHMINAGREHTTSSVVKFPN